jgi:hypothetical protein
VAAEASTLRGSLCIEVSREDGARLLTVLRAEQHRGLLIAVLHHGPTERGREFVAFVHGAVTQRRIKNILFASGIAAIVSRATTEMIHRLVQPRRFPADFPPLRLWLDL